MLRRVIVSLVVLGLLGACSAPREGPAGHVEVSVQGPCDGARTGQLRLEGASTIALSGRELCQGSFVRELPAGSYRVAWQGNAEDDVTATLRGTALLSVLPGRSTLLRLTLETAPSPLDPVARENDEQAPPTATCGYVARGGPS